MKKPNKFYQSRKDDNLAESNDGNRCVIKPFPRNLERASVASSPCDKHLKIKNAYTLMHLPCILKKRPHCTTYFSVFVARHFGFTMRLLRSNCTLNCKVSGRGAIHFPTVGDGVVSPMCSRSGPSTAAINGVG